MLARMPVASTPAPAFRNLPWPLTTERLTIRPAEPADADALWAHRGLPEVGKWLSWHPADRDEWNSAYPEKYGDFLVVEHDGRVIGDLVLHQVDGWAQRDVAAGGTAVQAEIGWTFHPDAGGRGFATEAVEAMIEVCFTGLGLRRIEAGAFADNEPSWRLMERVGMRRETHGVRDSLHRDLGWIDGVIYALLAEEWEARGR